MVIRAFGILAVVVVALVLAIRGFDSPSSRSAAAPTVADAQVPQPRCGNVLWSADHDTGDLSQWYMGDGGGESNSGDATASASDDVARSGRFSAKATILTPHVPDASGVRLFRWNESRSHSEACYGAWFYFPDQYIVPLWWNIFQFKSRSGATRNDAFWSLQVGNRPRGTMFVYLNWWEGLALEGPHQGESGGRNYPQTVKEIPVRRWTHLQVYLRQSSAFEGQIIVWQDDVELFNINGVRTRYPAENGANEWSVNNYSDIVKPGPTTIYIDDAAISAAGVAMAMR